MELSAAITSSGELYVCGQSNKIYTDQFLLIKNEFNLPMIIDKIELNNDKLFAIIGRVLEKETYVKKIFSLENDNKKYNSYLLKEIKFVDLDNNNSRVTTIKICTNENEEFVLCIDDNKINKFRKTLN